MRLVAPTPLVALQHDVRAHFGWSYQADQQSASMLRSACNQHPQAEASGWTPAARTQTLERIHDALMQIAGFATRQSLQEMSGKGLRIGISINAHFVMTVSIPVIDDSRQCTEQPICNGLLVCEITLWL